MGMSDRVGRRPVILLSILGSMLGSFWQGFASSYGSLIAARLFSGMCAGVGSVCQIYVADVAPKNLRSQSLGYLLASTQASALLGPAIGGALATWGLNLPLLLSAAMNA